MPADPPTARSEQLENIARQADSHTRHGFELAGRQAFFAARAEFVSALRLVAQGLDNEHRTTIHSRSLSAGLAAVKEAEEFLPRGTRLEAELDLQAIIASHRTPVLKSTPTETLQPMAAMRCYLTFSQEQLAAAAGHEVAGSMALYALGKLHASLARQKRTEIVAAEAKTVAFFQAALLVSPTNYMASNDLGVFLAQCGNLTEAQTGIGARRVHPCRLDGVGEPGKRVSATRQGRHRRPDAAAGRPGATGRSGAERRANLRRRPRAVGGPGRIRRSLPAPRRPAANVQGPGPRVEVQSAGVRGEALGPRDRRSGSVPEEVDP